MFMLNSLGFASISFQVDSRYLSIPCFTCFTKFLQVTSKVSFGIASKRILPLRLSYTPYLFLVPFKFLHPFPYIFQLDYQSQRGQKSLLYIIFVCWKFLCINKNFCDNIWCFCSISSKLLLAVFCRVLIDFKEQAAKKHLEGFPNTSSWFG